MKYSILVTLFSLFFTSLKAEVVYLKLDDSSIEYGLYNESNKKTGVQDYAITDKEGIASNFHGDEEQKLLYYIHSMYGNFGPYHKNSIEKLKDIEGYDKIVCIEWNAKRVGYRGSWKYAEQQGEQIGEIMDLLFSKNQNSIVCHSMGNRLFEGIATKLTAQAKFDKIILAASDLEMEGFKNGEYLNNFEVNEIVVLVNRHDQLLQLSKMIHRKDRLGLDGVDGELFANYENKENVDVWDVTNEVGRLRYGFGHVYFKRTEVIYDKLKAKLES